MDNKDKDCKEMSSRERFTTILEHKIPDRIPVFDFLFSKPLYNEILGMNIKKYNDLDYFLLADALGLDATLLSTGMPEEYILKTLSGDTFIDEWGTVYRIAENTWPSSTPFDHIINNKEDLKNLKIPDGSEEKRYFEAIKAIENNNNKLASIAIITGPFTMVMMIIGLSKMSEYIYDEPEFINDLLKITANYCLQLIEGFNKIGVDAILVADDLGFSGGTLFNPEWYRKNLFPYFRELVKEIKKKSMYPILHSDGDIRLIIQDIIDIGFVGLNPIEKKSNMDLKEIRERFGNKLTLSGNVDSSKTLVYGNKEEIIRETLNCMKGGGKEGAYILSSDHSFRKEIPNKNIFTMIETCKKYGKYPLNF